MIGEVVARVDVAVTDLVLDDEFAIRVVLVVEQLSAKQTSVS